MGNWRTTAGTSFEVEKRPAVGSRGMIVANHPLGAAAGAEMFAAGGNAFDAAAASLFALSVVEPMMVGIFGAGWMNIRLSTGAELVIDNYSVAPAAARPDMFRPVSETWPDYMKSVGAANETGYLSVGVPGTLMAWCELVRRFGKLDLESVMQPAIRHAERGFRATPYLCDCIRESAADLARFPESARVFLPLGSVPQPGEAIVQQDLAYSLRTIAAEGPDTVYKGSLGAEVVGDMARNGGIITRFDLENYSTIGRKPVKIDYRGFTIAGAPPPSSGGTHVAQMLRILEGFDIAGMGFGSPEGFHVLAEAMKVAFADRFATTGDPAFVTVPVEKLTSREYAKERRQQVRLDRASTHAAGVPPSASPHTTHVTAADVEGNVIAATQTINNLFGSKVVAAGTGLLLNNTMAIFDPHPGKANSISPGKRMTSSMAPTIVYREGRPVFALGLPGGTKIFPSVLQALVNIIDHGMSPQEAVEAPRIWTQGQALEFESRIPGQVCNALASRGHSMKPLPAVGGGMNIVQIGDDGLLTGAACWRADGTPIGVSGGLARPGVRLVGEGLR